MVPALKVYRFWTLVVLWAQRNQNFGRVCKKNTETLFVNFNFLDKLTNQPERQICKSLLAKLRRPSIRGYNDLT